MKDVLKQKAFRFTAGLGVIWLLMVAGDWALRFYWFRWQENLFTRSAEHVGGAGSWEVPAGRGGDLTRLLDVPSVAAAFEQPRPAYTEYRDEFGWPNRPPVEGLVFPLVVVGDSYMATGISPSNSFRGSLSALSGLPVYNYAEAGRGPMFSIERLVADPRFQGRPPSVVIWGLVEREIGGDMFAGLVARIKARAVAQPGVDRARAFRLEALSPRELTPSLSRSSAVAQLARKAWGRIRYYVLGAWSADVTESSARIAGRRVLFYVPAAKAMRWTRAERKPELMAEGIRYVAGILRERGVALVVVLIPDKEQTYRELLPASLRDAPPGLAPSCLNDIEAELSGSDVRVVNLLPIYRNLAARDRLLYWPDDTHWNPEGIDVAAAATWDALREIVSGQD